METKCYAQVCGSVIRVTRLSARGVPIYGDESVVVSKGISTITINETTDVVEDLRLTNDFNELRIVSRPKTEVLNFPVDLDLCGVDPGMISMFTGQDLVADGNGDYVGFGVDTRIELGNFGFAVEVWSRIAGGACNDDGDRLWGYTLFPYLKGGHISGFTFENAAVKFKITGAKSRRGGGWDIGPHRVMLDADGDPTFLLEQVGFNRQWQNFLTTVQPPEPACGMIALTEDVIFGGSASSTSSDVINNGSASNPGVGQIYGGRA